MVTQVEATLINGVLKPDQELSLPDQTRVRLTVEPIEDRAAKGMAAWQSLKERIRQRPINAAGLHYTRDELHERR